MPLTSVEPDRAASSVPRHIRSIQAIQLTLSVTEPETRRWMSELGCETWAWNATRRHPGRMAVTGATGKGYIAGYGESPPFPTLLAPARDTATGALLFVSQPRWKIAGVSALIRRKSWNSGFCPAV